MKVVDFAVPYSQAKGATFIPIGCIHWPLSNKAVVRSFVRELQQQPNAFGMLLGDNFDAHRGSYRNHLAKWTRDRNSQISDDRGHLADVLSLATLLKPVSRQLIGILSGNHYHMFVDQLTGDQKLAAELQVPFLGIEGVARVTFMDGKQKRTPMIIAAHHSGRGSYARTWGGDVNALHDYEKRWDADIYALAHTHKLFAFSSGQYTVSPTGKVVKRQRLFIRAGAALEQQSSMPINSKSVYVPDYATEAAYPPLHPGFMLVHIDHFKKENGTLRYFQMREETARIV